MLTQFSSVLVCEVLSFDSSWWSFLHYSVILRKQLQLEGGPMAPEESLQVLIQTSNTSTSEDTASPPATAVPSIHLISTTWRLYLRFLFEKKSHLQEDSSFLYLTRGHGEDARSPSKLHFFPPVNSAACEERVLKNLGSCYSKLRETCMNCPTNQREVLGFCTS